MINDHYYGHPDIDRIWYRGTELKTWLDIELALIRTLTGMSLTGDQRAVLQGYVFPSSVAQAEQTTRHEVGAFLHQVELGLERLADPGVRRTWVAKLTRDESLSARRWLHYGLTSSDLVESGRLIALWRSSVQLQTLAAELCTVVQVKLDRAPVPGRTHGQIASPTTAAHRFEAALPKLLPFEELTNSTQIKLSGAVGRSRVLDRHGQFLTARHLSERIEVKATLAPASTQVPPAWLYTRHLHVWSDWVTACEQIATDYRHLATLGELTIPTSAGQVGSSTMPGKVNPYLAERVCGLAAAWRGMYSAVLNTRVLWLDRDLSHSSVDRMNYPQMASTLGYMLKLTAQLLSQAQFPPVDLSAVEPNIDADALLGFATEQFDIPRSAAYEAVSDVVRSRRTTRDALIKLCRTLDPERCRGAGLNQLVREYQSSYTDITTP